jgi:hypothetical protein
MHRSFDTIALVIEHYDTRSRVSTVGDELTV